MQVNTVKKGPVLVAKISGELDHHSIKVFKRQMDRLLKDAPEVEELQLDLGGLSFMDSSGIGAVLGWYKTMNKRRGRVTVKNMNRTVGKIFEMSGLFTVIDRVG
ncbi:anti-sigma factor antagonist [Eubacteriales bacterium OttesenSCG-928-M02]|nr:anti-sigma factor antagonist [Eubacteriales bacterium OttesenSCG-928-M02]